MSQGTLANSRKGIMPASKFLYIPCHESSGTDLPYETHNGEGVLSWQDAWSELRAQPSGTTMTIVDDQSFDEIFNLATLSSGGLLILFTMEYDTKPSATERLFQFGAINRVLPGGINITLTTTSIVANIVPQSAAVDTSSAVKVFAAAATAPLTVALYIDIANGEQTLATGGSWSTAITDTRVAAIKAAGLLVDSTAGDYALSLFGRHDDAGLGDLQIVNSGTGNVSLSDMWFIRFETDKQADISAIVNEYEKYPKSRLWALDNE